MAAEAVAATGSTKGAWIGPADDTVVIRLGPGRDPVAYALAAAAALLSVAAVAYFARQGEIPGHQDSFSHLEISRRILVGRSPGLAQLGGVWLPLPHLLQALFAWNWTLYRTGLAGSLVSMAAYVAAVVLIYLIIRELTGRRRWAAAAGATLFMANPNVLYLQGTSLDELPFYAFTLGAVFGLIRWASTRRATYVLVASIANMLAMLCRYEAWFLGAVYLACVVVGARRLGYPWRDVRGLGLVCVVFGSAVAASAWLAYNWLIFGNPVNFLDGPDSSAGEMARQSAEPEIGNWALTLRAYGIAVASNVGLAVVGLGVLGLIVLVVRERLSGKSLPVLALTLLVPFMVYSLESGEEPISVPQINDGLLNLRFGLLVILPAAILTGYLLGRVPRPVAAPTAVAAMLALVGICAATVSGHQVVLAAEAAEDAVALEPQADIGDRLAAQTRGAILLDLVWNERLAFPVLDRVVYAGTRDSRGSVWARDLKAPAANGIRVIVMRTTAGNHDAVYRALHDSPALGPYREAFHNADYAVYVLRSPDNHQGK